MITKWNIKIKWLEDQVEGFPRATMETKIKIWKFQKESHIYPGGVKRQHRTRNQIDSTRYFSRAEGHLRIIKVQEPFSPTNGKRQTPKTSRDVKNRSLSKKWESDQCQYHQMAQDNRIDAIKSLKKNYFQPKILHPEKLLFKCESKISFQHTWIQDIYPLYTSKQWSISSGILLIAFSPFQTFHVLLM